MTPLFKSAHAAVKFAVNCGNESHIGRSTVSKLADPPKGADTGLVGLDGVGQAAMVLSMIRSSMDRRQEACLVARCSVHKLSCSCGAACCSRSRPNWTWFEAINFLSMEATLAIEEDRKPGTRGIQDNPAIRQALIAKYFGERVRISELAKACDITDSTVTNHNSKITKMLKKSEGEAWSLIEERLRDAFLIF